MRYASLVKASIRNMEIGRRKPNHLREQKTLDVAGGIADRDPFLTSVVAWSR
jgi:hypothetical protein